jgi:hypothetical protein
MPYTFIYLKPTGDVLTQWQGTTPHWRLLDDDPFDSQTGGFIQGDETDLNDVDQFTFETTTNVAIVVSMFQRIHAVSLGNERQPWADMYLGGWFGEKQYVGLNKDAWGTYVVGWPFVNKSLAELNTAQSRIRVPSSMVKGDLIRVEALGIIALVLYEEPLPHIDGRINHKINRGIAI